MRVETLLPPPLIHFLCLSAAAKLLLFPQVG
jgi:hypothetical protein